MPVPLGELLAILAQDESVVDDLGEGRAERGSDPPVNRLVGAVIRAADDMSDRELDVVHDRRQLVGGRPVRAYERRPFEPDRAVRIAHRTACERSLGLRRV